eukprot:646601-Pleurochrysis_carterae.AAC.1
MLEELVATSNTIESRLSINRLFIGVTFYILPAPITAPITTLTHTGVWQQLFHLVRQLPPSSSPSLQMRIQKYEAHRRKPSCNATGQSDTTANHAIPCRCPPPFFCPLPAVVLLPQINGTLDARKEASKALPTPRVRMPKDEVLEENLRNVEGVCMQHLGDHARHVKLESWESELTLARVLGRVIATQSAIAPLISLRFRAAKLMQTCASSFVRFSGRIRYTLAN